MRLVRCTQVNVMWMRDQNETFKCVYPNSKIRQTCGRVLQWIVCVSMLDAIAYGENRLRCNCIKKKYFFKNSVPNSFHRFRIRYLILIALWRYKRPTIFINILQLDYIFGINSRFRVFDWTYVDREREAFYVKKSRSHTNTTR